MVAEDRDALLEESANISSEAIWRTTEIRQLKPNWNSFRDARLIEDKYVIPHSRACMGRSERLVSFKGSLGTVMDARRCFRVENAVCCTIRPQGGPQKRLDMEIPHAV